MAPEQASADPLTDHRADIYAFGCDGVRAAHGQPPFAGRPPSATLAAHVKEEPEPVDRPREALPPALRNSLCGAWPSARRPAAERRRDRAHAGKRRHPGTGLSPAAPSSEDRRVSTRCDVGLSWRVSALRYWSYGGRDQDTER
jgi:serine/threonine-protein kinase